MTRRKAPLQVNQLRGGLKTESNLLETELEYCKDELNMDMVRDGSRRKRLGFDYEDSRVFVDTGVVIDESQSLGSNIVKWQNPGGQNDKELVAVQVANSFKIFDLDNSPISGTEIYTETFSSDTYDKVYSMAVVDGLLVVVNGDKNIAVYDYDPIAETVSKDTETLYIRDLFGVQAYDGSTDLTLSQNLRTRPSTLSDEHLYNLRNQGYHTSYRNGNAESLIDPISAFYSESSSTEYPSNSDLITKEIYADPNDTDNRLVDRFFASNLYETRAGNSEPPRGHFIIDALTRGASRASQVAALESRDSNLSLTVSSLSTDKTPGGASAIAEHAGRIWYAGFSGDVEGGDSKSPRMSSYVLFSTLVKDRSDVGKCYQEADPTDKDDSALAATDGGFIRIAGAYGIKKLVSLHGGLFIFAENGIWLISGGQGAAFSATNYEVVKISDNGTINNKSVVVSLDTVWYWGPEAIYSVVKNEFGEFVVQDRSTELIKTFYQDIPIANKKVCSGYYDPFSQQIRWVYNKVDTDDDIDSENRELVIDLRFNAFIPYSVPTTAASLPKIIGVEEAQPYPAESRVFNVYDSAGANVTDSSLEDVTVTVDIRTGTVSSGIYLVIGSITNSIKYSFGSYRDVTFYDWVDEGVSAGYENYLETSDISAGEPRSRKQVPYFHTFFKRTETGVDDNLDPVNNSSCLVSGKWGWTDNTISGKWTTARQAYRYNRLYIVANSSDNLETGDFIIQTKSRIKGNGSSIRFRLEGEAGKNLHVYGWSFNLLASNED